MIQIFGEKSRLFSSMLSGRVTKIFPPFPPLSEDKGLRDIGHIMSIANLTLGVNNVTVSYLIRYHSLLHLILGANNVTVSYLIRYHSSSQNATYIITKCDS